jgi:hypothetical protein
MSRKDEAPFFIGYLDPPRALRPFLIAVAVFLVLGFAGAGLLLGAVQEEPEAAAFRFDWGPQTLEGVLRLDPYPTLFVTEGTERVAAGTTVMLAGVGKTGVQERTTFLNGRRVRASGIILKRGELDMMQVSGGEASLAALPGYGPAVPGEPLGRWRLAGEICDGKCLAGAMRPGQGPAHKACANLCLVGGIPPVFVASAPLAGEEFLLIGGPDGGPLPDALYDQVATLVELEAEVERRGDILVMRVDPATVRELP